MNAFFSIGFRSMFAAATLFAAVGFVIWGQFWSLSNHLPFSPFGSYLYWHPHELIMGVTFAIIAGFLLTAVQNWTGMKTASSRGIKLLLTSWLVARFFMLFDTGLPIGIFLLIQSTPGLLLCFFIARPILYKRMIRNYFAPLSILILTILDAVSLLAVHKGEHASNLFYAQIILILTIISIIASRIIPFFTANKLKIERAVEPILLKATVTVSLILLCTLYLLPDFLWKTVIIQMASIIVSAASFARLYIWHHKGIWREPMLYILWLSYSLFAVGFLMMGFSDLFNIHSVALHVLAIGALGGMSISMLTRVSLGHTGRVITHDPIILLSLTLLLISLLGRTLVVWLGGFNYHIITASAYIAASAFLLLFIRFIKVWYQPRPDHRS